ncbi:MAG TPA: prepilin-type N-terminal cleavage/methylation domain-containing protein [Candidatus Eremiobacteraceae bacterium]|nr:prepilin-type N-terminal cleavage/methylation domain-containing protein [Candidatus Eremiobacteraceae bacterium]
MKQADKKFGKRLGQRGFALVEVMIAMVILSVGMCAVLASFGVAITATESAQEDLMARQKALQTLESIYTARNSQQIPWSSINNTSANPPGIFAVGPQTMLCAGPVYGIVGVQGDTSPCTTASGATCPNGGVECMVLPGPDGILGTGDDETLTLNNFTRTIAFTPVNLPVAQGGGLNTNLISVTVTVTYTKPNWPARSYVVNGLISNYH